ncbi:hypothetical protein ACOMHN_018330 [Nucella lapillus]
MVKKNSLVTWHVHLGVDSALRVPDSCGVTGQSPGVGPVGGQMVSFVSFLGQMVSFVVIVGWVWSILWGMNFVHIASK